MAATQIEPAVGSKYTEEFYKGHLDGSLRSAREVVPLMLSIVRPGSVIDVGCGVGTWLSVFHEHGVSDVMGVDGEYVDRQALMIPAQSFTSANLEKPFHLGRRFDLVVCLEVIEHLPKQCSEALIQTLVDLGPVILFSGAIPHQGGTNHLNEQWPEYWASRFLQHGYLAIDCLRKRIWRNPSVAPWYAQNILLFVEENYLHGQPLLKAEYENTEPSQLSVVHPAVYMQWADPARRDPKYASLGRLLAGIPFALRRTLRAKLRGTRSNGGKHPCAGQ